MPQPSRATSDDLTLLVHYWPMGTPTIFRTTPVVP